MLQKWKDQILEILNWLPYVTSPDPGDRAQNLRRHSEPPTPGKGYDATSKTAQAGSEALY